MGLKLMYVTNRPAVAAICEECGVDRVFLDLERIGKDKRQRGLNTVKSDHSIADIPKVRAALKKAELLVRCNPINAGSEAEIEAIAQSGADIVMLPYFKTADEVSAFLRLLGGRKRTCLLFETPDAMRNADKILDLGGIDETFIGLNDLHLGYGQRFMFQPLADGKVDCLAETFRRRLLPFGFGGVARPEDGTLKGRYIIGEHYRLGSSSVILSRSFCDSRVLKNIDRIRDIMKVGVAELRRCESFFAKASEDVLLQNRAKLVEKVDAIVRELS